MGAAVAGLSLLSRKRRVPPIPEPEQVGAFHDRLARVKTGAAARNVIWVGSDEAIALPSNGHASPRTRRHKLIAGIGLQFRRALLVVLGFAGYGAWVIGLYLSGGLAHPIANADIAMDVNFAGGFFVATLAARLLRVGLRDLMFWKALGAAAGVLLFQDVVHLYPHIFALLAPHWTHDILVGSKPASLFWRGAYYPLF